MDYGTTAWQIQEVVEVYAPKCGQPNSDEPKRPSIQQMIVVGKLCRFQSHSSQPIVVGKLCQTHSRRRVIDTINGPVSNKQSRQHQSAISHELASSTVKRPNLVASSRSQEKTQRSSFEGFNRGIPSLPPISTTTAKGDRDPSSKERIPTTRQTRL